jgi:diguanylate cyclase (GGDEF)-like protein
MTAKILIVDDTPQNIDLLRQILQPLECKLLVANSGEVAINIISRNAPDLILLDVMMPGMDGFEVCRQIKADPSCDNIPIIFVTARQGDISTGFAAGGDDYITKPVNADEVVARVTHQLDKLRLLRELKQLNEALDDKVRDRTAKLAVANRQLREEVNERRYMQDRLRYLAEHDFVTRVYNRNALDAYVTSLIEEIQRIGLSSVYLQIDLDNFRLVNESCGCLAGDELLREVSDLIGAVVGPEDFLARLGGDRFAVVCRGLSESQARQLAENIRSQMEVYQFGWEGRSFEITTSVALVNMTEQVDSFDQLLIMADEVIYLAKRQDGNLVRSYDDNTQGATAHRSQINWALVILDALKKDRLEIHIQQVALLRGAVVAQEQDPIRLECLSRIRDDAGQLIFPDAFIPPAERFNLIAKIDRFVIGKVCQFLADNKNIQDIISNISINLSAVTIRRPGLVDYIVEQIKTYSIQPSKLCFEITETQSITNVAATSEFMKSLKELGCTFSLDDFGSGYASFNYLRELPFDHVKIDGLFIKGLARSQSNQTFVKSVVEIAEKLNLDVVAEYVEDIEDIEILAEMGVDWGQGYGIHKPEKLSSEAIWRIHRSLDTGFSA